MKASDVEKYLTYCGFEADLAHRATRLWLPSTRQLITGAFVLLSLILALLAIYAGRPGESLLKAPPTDQATLMDEPTPVPQGAANGVPYGHELVSLPQSSHPECYGEWYCLFAAIAQILAVE
ncbi:MAG: hypothetical protein QUS33_11450 [Dehalococcoidia bacterium]|nr:hypothetical protein [Dehalococcoidia bacterium]